MFLGDRCNRGHVGWRYKKSNECVFCLRARMKRIRHHIYSQRPRQEALRSNQMYYVSVPCKHGHSGLRYTKDGKCVQCAREYDRAAYKSWRWYKLVNDPVAYKKYLQRQCENRRLRYEKYSKDPEWVAKQRAAGFRYRQTEGYKKAQANWLAKRRNTLLLIHPELTR